MYCDICGFLLSNRYAEVALFEDDWRSRKLRVCGLCFADATLDAIDRASSRLKGAADAKRRG
jgi:hypothetical protein